MDIKILVTPLHYTSRKKMFIHRTEGKYTSMKYISRKKMFIHFLSRAEDIFATFGYGSNQDFTKRGTSAWSTKCSLFAKPF